MNNKSLLILAGVTLVLLLYIVFFGKDDPGTDALRKQAEQVLVFDRETVDRIEIESPDATLLISKQEGAAWKIEKPIEYTADRNRIDRLLSELEFSRKVATLDEEAFRDPEEAVKNMGLADPRMRLKLRTEEGVRQLLIGVETPRENQVYARSESGKRSQWMVVRKDIEDVLKGTVNDWRSKKLFHMESSEITGLLLSSDGPDVEVAREEGDWKIKKPFASATEPEQMRSYLANLLAGQIQAFGADDGADLAEYGLNNPKITLTVQTISGNSVLRIGNPVEPKESGPNEKPVSPEKYYAQLESNKVVLEIPRKIVEQISGLLFEVREKRVLPRPVARLNYVSYQGFGLDLAFKREQALWDFVDEELSASSPEIDEFLNSLQSARAEDFLQDSEANRKQFGLDQPEITLEIGATLPAEENDFGEEAGSTRLEFSSIREGVRYVRSGFSDFILKVVDGELPDFPQDRVVWLARALEVPVRSEIQAITWKVPTGTLVLERGGDGQWPAEYEGRAMDQEYLFRQFDILKSLQILDRRRVNNSSFAKSELTLNLKTEEGVMVMEFSLPENRQVLMRLSKDPEGYVLREEDYQRLKVFPINYREGENE